LFRLSIPCTASSTIKSFLWASQPQSRVPGFQLASLLHLHCHHRSQIHSWSTWTPLGCQPKRPKFGRQNMPQSYFHVPHASTACLVLLDILRKKGKRVVCSSLAVRIMSSSLWTWWPVCWIGLRNSAHRLRAQTWRRDFIVEEAVQVIDNRNKLNGLCLVL